MRRQTASSSPRRRRAAPAGFTLVELLVVIGIIALLIGLLIPVIAMVTRSGRRTVTAATLSSISSALENYKADFDDYPRFQPDPAGNDPLNQAPDRGARLLARVLMGVAPQDHKPKPGDSDPTPGDPQYLFRDGHGTLSQPFGWKERRQTVTRTVDGEVQQGVVYPGEVYGPYLDADSFNVRKTTDATLTTAGYVYGPDAVLLDNNDMPILYYPARLKNPDISAEPGTNPSPPPYWSPNGLVWDQGYEEAPGAKFNAYDNRGAMSADRLSTILGDYDDDNQWDLGSNNLPVPDGRIGEGETAAHTGPYLLIATGSGGTFEEDVVTNFTPAPEPPDRQGQ